MNGAEIIVVGSFIALIACLFWRQIALAAGFLVLAILFIGILTLIVQGMEAVNGG